MVAFLTGSQIRETLLKTAEVHTLAPGENIGVLSRRWGVTEEQIFDANADRNLKERATKLQIGEPINKPRPPKELAKDLNAMPIAEQIGRAATIAGVDQGLFRAMIQVESENCTRNLSHAGAIGCGQLMPHIVKLFGIDPHNTAQNLVASAMYLSSLLKQSPGQGDEKSWNALMMYNWGPGNFGKWYEGGMNPAHLTAEAKNHPIKVFKAWGREVPKLYKKLYSVPEPMAKTR